MDIHAHRETHTHTCAHTHTTQTHTEIHKQAHTQTLRDSHTDIRMHTQTYTHMHGNAQAHTHTHTHSFLCSLRLSSPSQDPGLQRGLAHYCYRPPEGKRGLNLGPSAAALSRVWSSPSRKVSVSSRGCLSAGLKPASTGFPTCYVFIRDDEFPARDVHERVYVRVCV